MLRYDLVPDSTGVILHGLGELELEVAVMRLMRDFQIELEIGAPNVAYRETIAKVKEQDYTHKKPTGPSGQYARVRIRFEPLPAGGGYIFENVATNAAVPAEYMPGVVKGLDHAKESGVVAGFPMIDFKATLIDGAHHPVDSSVIAFDVAARACFREAIPQAGPKLLEPMMKVEVVTPLDYLGDVIGDLNSRRGQTLGMDSLDDAHAVSAMVPLSNLFGYVNALRSMTGGRAQHTMRFDHYEQVRGHWPPDDSPAR